MEENLSTPLSMGQVRKGGMFFTQKGMREILFPSPSSFPLIALGGCNSVGKKEEEKGILGSGGGGMGERKGKAGRGV